MTIQSGTPSISPRRKRRQASTRPTRASSRRARSGRWSSSGTCSIRSRTNGRRSRASHVSLLGRRQGFLAGARSLAHRAGMRTRILLGSLLALSLLALPARAQVQMQITIGLPVVLPPMVVVQPGYVPASLVRIPPGQYRHIRHEEWKRMERERREREKAERRAWKERERNERHEWKDREKAEHAERHR